MSHSLSHFGAQNEAKQRKTQGDKVTDLPMKDRWKLSVAPMMDWTDRHCRYLHRLITRHALLYTEMVTTGALLYGDCLLYTSPSPRD